MPRLNELLQLDRPLVVLDVETTGLSVTFDKIIQIGLQKFYPDGQMNEWSSFIDPKRSIPQESTKIHGIGNDTVRDAPIFRDVASLLLKGLNDCYVGGFNVQFDLNFLNTEFWWIGCKDFKPGPIVDALRIFRRYHPRDLTAAVRTYCNKEHVDAHDALGDVRATSEVLAKQLEAHDDLPRDPQRLYELLFETIEEGYVDADKKFRYVDGEIVVNFGNKFNGVKLTEVNARYLNWMLKENFSEQTKDVVRQEKERRTK